MSARSPGWFRDDRSPEQLRYWDGQRWTDFRLTAPTQAPENSGAWPRRHPISTVVLGLLAVVLFATTIGDGGPEVGEPPSAGTAGPEAGDAAPEPKATQTAEPVPADVATPRLVGQSVAAARDTLRRSDLAVRVRRAVSGKKPGTVLRQSARPGLDIAPGSAVTLVVSAPWPRVPGVEGLSAPAAVSRLTNAGFRVATTVRSVSRGRDAVVLTQTSAAGRAVKPSSTIRLVVSDLRRPKPAPASNCATGYSPCLAPMSDYDCAGGSGDGPGYAEGPITVTGSDPYDLDSESDGTACES